MRTGEVFALTWNDIDLKNRLIRINKTVYSKLKDENGRWFLGTAKTEGSCREVYICDTLYKALCNYKKQQQLYKKKYGNNYKKYLLEPIKNKYGKIVEYKIIESNIKIEIMLKWYLHTKMEAMQERMLLNIHLKLYIMNYKLKIVDFMI